MTSWKLRVTTALLDGFAEVGTSKREARRVLVRASSNDANGIRRTGEARLTLEAARELYRALGRAIREASRLKVKP